MNALCLGIVTQLSTRFAGKSVSEVYLLTRCEIYRLWNVDLIETSTRKFRWSKRSLVYGWV